MSDISRVLTTAQMSFCEKESEKYGVSLAKLMDNAGEKLAKHILSCCKEFDSQKAVLLIGKGNNGGDGLVAACILKEKGVEPILILCSGEPSTELSKNAFNKLPKNIKIYSSPDKQALSEIENAGILVDCIFGTGFHGSLREEILPVFKACQNSKAYKIACDVPSGANARNGQSDKLAFKADKTVTFHRKKLGLCISPCKYFCGQITAEDIDIPNQCETNLDMDITEFCNIQAKSFLPERIPNGHKGTYGKIISVCGCENYIGAAGISTLSAMKSGVGLVELCTAKAVISAMSSRILECIYSQMETDESGCLTAANAERILEKCKNASCLLIGCGLGHTKETEKLVAKLVEKSPCPIVIDADGINSLCPNIDVLYKAKSKVILTPHPAELARLCGCEISEIIENRFEKAAEFSKKYNAAVLAKSAETIAINGNKAYIVAQGNSALSKGGSGDMLAGITASLAAQGKDLLSAGTLASYIMGKAAEKAAETNSERSLLAADIMNYFSLVFKDLES